jgi:hypothetical protein
MQVQRELAINEQAVMLLLRLCAMIVVLQVLQALPLYSDVANSSYALVLCSGLDRAIAELRAHELSEHVIGADWLEQDCVTIDVCKQVSSNHDRVLAGVWNDINSTALRLPSAARRRSDAEAGLRAYNEAALEYARIAEGLRVETCSPDFDLARRTGRIACDETTVRRLEADDTARACPGEVGFSLLDCVKPLQHDAETTQLFRRAAHEKAHFGSLSRAEACGGAEHLPEVAAQLCRDLEEYSMDVPAAARVHESLMRSLGHQKLPTAGHGTTSLVRYEFLPGYACLGPEALVGTDTVLSRRAAPNRVVSCPSVKNGKAKRNSAWTCGIDCDWGFRLESGVCVSGCAGMNETCAAGAYAAETCQEGPKVMYRCEQCVPRAGHGAAAWDKARPEDCQYEICEAGRHSEGLDCVDCPVNTFSNASGATACFSCDTLATGLYQRQSGKTACHACLWNQEEPQCEPGAAAASSWQVVENAFDSYRAHGHEVELKSFNEEYCTAGKVCLPCAPGHASADGSACVACLHGKYMPNIGSTACYRCHGGQNTSSVASTKASDCVCEPGFE